ncbi:hypothetical protein GGR53DRAFT_183319 [Hypoxylon sp. FL1150]|nr:hypothetical protein GGR53DRAFT_183319 [Hypoxylon sp. FL1150]
MAPPSPSLFVPAGDHEPNVADYNSASASYDVDDAGDDEKEWNVEDVYAERPHPDRPGEFQYLIKWEGFPVDECTWEPVEHLGDGLLEDWENNKREIAAGKRQPFDVEIYNAACRAKLEQLESPLEKISPVAEHNPIPGNPAQEAGVTGPGPLASKDKAEKATKPKPKESHVSPPSKPKAATSAAPNVPKKRPSKDLALPKPPKAPKQTPTPKRTVSSDKSDKPSGGTVTGYQGTARRPSESAGSGSGSISASKRPPLPPTLSSSLANKISGKKHTATRTQPQPTPTQAGNVFAGGKQRRKRANLGDTMDDKSKTPKAFNNMRIMNIAKKKGTERNEQAHLDISAIPSHFLLTKDKNVPPPEAATSPSAPLGPSAMVESPTAMSPGAMSKAKPTPTLKTKKSVRFTGAQDITPDDVPMVDADDVPHKAIGEQASTAQSSIGSGSARSPPQGPRKLSLTNYQTRNQTQVVQKAAVFGKPGSQSVRVLFSGITRQVQPWVPFFIAQEVLNFNTICASYNFMVQKGDLVGEILSAGTIGSASRETLMALRNVAENLRRGSYGNHLVTEYFSILVYPSGCNAWNELGVNTEAHDSEFPLRYMIYKSPIDPKLHPPMTVPRAPAPLSSIEQGAHCQVLLKHLFGLDFSKCLPQHAKQKDNQVFMLLFPEREMQLCNLVKLWLRSCQPNCRIFSAEIKDSYIKFHETVRAGAAGTFILHEDMSASVRAIPLLSHMNDNRGCYTFWNLGTGRYNPPRFPSDIDATIEPGSLQMIRLFPHGRAFLITPSLALSDPVKLCHFLEWFRAYCFNPHYIMMACADFPDYLKAITLEKATEHEEMCLSHKDDPKLETLLAELGLSRADLEARFKAWQILVDIIKQKGDEEASYAIRKVNWITDCIDPNDEQSLVNWFCWWATTKCDRYRKFSVLGSSNSRSRAAYRTIEVPAYTAETVGDPDVAWEREYESRRAREAREAKEAKEAAKDEVDHDVSKKSRSTSSSHAPATPVSRSAPNLHIIPGSSLRVRIRDLYGLINDRTIRINPWVRLHANPVAWLDVPMADHFEDSRFEYDTFKNWLGAFPPCNRGVNTWFGLFYTIDKEWDLFVPPKTYGRHPWIAVIRPRNPHFPATKYAEIELFIWDISAEKRAESQGPSSLLLDMQRRLISRVREEIAEKDDRFFLYKVYVNSRIDPNLQTTGESPMDTTFKTMEAMLCDGKKWLPVFENFLPKSGWMKVDDSEWERGMPAVAVPRPSTSTQQQREKQPQQQQKKHQQGGIPFPRHPSDETKTQRSIWHPPRPRAKLDDKSRCGNDLYKAAFRARMTDFSCRVMRYQYRSTTDWYHDMKREGRTTSLVYVETADKIMASLPPLQKK